MSFLVGLGFALGAFVAGVIFSDKVKSWFKAKAATATTATEAAVAAEVTKVEAKL